ncbi:MAG: RIP metalloprotease RseP [Pseudomonadota bacterium]
MTILTYVFAFLFAVGLLVAVHEYGHYWMARRLGFKVLRFSVGFGKPLFRRVAGADRTEYVLGSLPLGGYVKMLDEREGPVAEHEVHRSYNRRPPSYRIAVLFAGPAANFLFAIAAFWLIFLVGMPGLRPFVGATDAGTPAAEAGLQVQDLILAVDGNDVQTWEGTLLAIYRTVLDNGEVPLTVERYASGARDSVVLRPTASLRELTRPGELLPGLGLNVWIPDVPPIIGEVPSDGPAASAGVLPGDRILAVGDAPVDVWSDFVDQVRPFPGRSTSLTVVRADGSEAVLAITLGEQMDGEERVGYAGVAASPLSSETIDQLWSQQRFGPVVAARNAAAKTWEMTSLTLDLFRRMLFGQVSVENLSGPINIAVYAGDTFRSGFVDFVRFLALVSVSLGLINLMPVPMLDGGQIVFTAIEGVRGSPLSDRVQLLGQQVGIFAVLALMTLALYNDLSRLIG